MIKKNIYLDNAAATPLDKKVFSIMQPYLVSEYANPSSVYGAGRKNKTALDNARSIVAKILGAKKNEIIFTAGATESINLALQGIAKTFNNTEIVSTNIEHDAVLGPLRFLKSQNHQIKLIPVKKNGIIDLDQFIKTINNQTVLVSVNYANHEIGTIQPIAEIGKQITKIRSERIKHHIKLPLYFHTDASQAGLLDLHVSRLGVDLMSLNGAKIYGPKQSGCLYIRTGVKIQPIIYGGGQERNLRSGTENIANDVGFAIALELIQQTRTAENKRQKELRDYLITRIESSNLKGFLNGDRSKRLNSNLNFTFFNIDGEALVMALDQFGIAVSTGSACSVGQTESSHVLRAIGLSEKNANSSLRITLGKQNIKADLDYLIKVLPKAIALARKVSAR